MTTYSPDYTGRYRAKYVSAGVVHVAQLRKFRGATVSQITDLAGTMQSVFATWAADLPTDFAWISAEYCEQDSNLFIPTSTPAAVTGVRAPSGYTPLQKITSTTFAGRAPGSKARLSIFGVFWEETNIEADDNTKAYNGIIESAEDARIATTKGLLDSQWSANSGVNAVTYARATVKINDYWLRQVRKGTVS
jgi:hypothetical protein